MTRRKLLYTSTMLLISLMLTGAACQTVLVETGKKAFEDRSTSDQIADAKLVGSITADLTMKDKSLLLDVSTDVWEQRVLLTGTLTDSRVKEEIASIV